MKHSLRPLRQLWERSILLWASKVLHPMHPEMPRIVLWLNDSDNAPSPLDPADSLVTAACVIACVFLLIMVALGALPGGST